LYYKHFKEISLPQKTEERSIKQKWDLQFKKARIVHGITRVKWANV
jgi:hypothetical protein